MISSPGVGGGRVGGMNGWMDDGMGLISERLGLMGSAAVGEIVQTRHVVCRKEYVRCARQRQNEPMLIIMDY